MLVLAKYLFYIRYCIKILCFLFLVVCCKYFAFNFTILLFYIAYIISRVSFFLDISLCVRVEV